MAGMIEVFLKCKCGADAMALARVEKYAKENRIMFSYSLTSGRRATKLDFEKHDKYAAQIGVNRSVAVVVYDDGEKVMRLLEWKP